MRNPFKIERVFARSQKRAGILFAGWMLFAWQLCAAGSAQAATSTFSFTLDEPCKTSAGVFAPDGTLIRTLWSKVRYNAAGTYSAVWDGLDDSGNAVSAGTFQIKLLQHNTEYVWDGAIGNTSAELAGPTIHRGFYPMRDMAIAGTNAFYVSGYNEGMYDFRTFATTDPQHVKIAWGADNNPANIYDPTWNWTATDGNCVYFACSAATNPTNTLTNNFPGFILAAKVGVASPAFSAYFSQGVPIVNGAGTNAIYPNGVYVGTQPGLSGLAVQQNGNLLAASVAPDNKVYLLDKQSGAVLNSFSVNSPRRLNFSPDGSLWVISGNNVTQYLNLSSNPTAGRVISNFSEPLDVAVNPTNPNLILVADGSSSQQVKAFTSAGAPLWTYGLAGGYQVNGAAVANNKFWFNDGEGDATFLCFAPDGSFWVGDGGNYRSLHFSANLNYIEQIMYQPHTYLAAVDQNNPTRVLNQFLEFKVDYTNALPHAWTLVNNWKVNVDPVHISWNQGLYEVATLSNGRTYSLIDNNSGRFAMSELCELTTNQLRFTGLFPAYSGTARGWISLAPDGSARRTTIGSATWYQATLSGFDANNNPVWNPETLLTSAPEGSTDPVPRGSSFGNIRATISTNNILISFDQSLNNGFHLGGIKLGTTKWLWRASPAAGWMNGLGTYEISNGVFYAGNTMQAVDRQIVYGYHGEFFRGQGQAGQHMHFYDDGLFIGQFGEANIGHSAYEGSLPGSAGNGHCPNFLKLTNGDYYLWVNDESGHGPQRWHFINARNIREQIGSGTLGSAITLTNQIYNFPTAVVGASGNQSGTLSWQPVQGATSYNIYYSPLNGGPYTALAGSTSGLAYTISGLTNGQPYYCVVTAIRGGVEGTPSEQVPINPFDTTQTVLTAGSMTEGGQLTPVIDVTAAAPALGQPSYTTAEHATGLLNLRELDYYGYGNLENETVGTKGYWIFNWQGAGIGLTNFIPPLSVTYVPGWATIPFLQRQFRVDGVLGITDGMISTPLNSLNINSTDTNYHFLTVVSPAQFNNPRQFALRLTSANNTSAVFNVNESPGLSHIFQFLFKGNATLWADATGGQNAIVQAVFLDNAAVTYSWVAAPPVQSTTITTTMDVTSQNPAQVGSTVTFTALVTSGSGTPSGTVTFFDGANNLGTATLNGSGMAAVSTASLSASGSPHAITAVYSGNGTFGASTSTVLSELITVPTSTTILASSQNPALAGSTVTFTATVSSSAGTPAGTVAFLDGTSSLGSATLNGSGQATISTTTLSAGGSPHSITAAYSGSSTFSGSTSVALSQIITNAPVIPTTPGVDITNGLVAWYPLAGDANDYSGNGNNGKPAGSPTYTAGISGVSNTAISLNGSSQYISLGHPNLYNFGTGDFTMSVWFRTTSISTPQQLISCDDASGRQFIFDLNDLSAGTITAYIQDQTSDVGYRTGKILSPNTWYSAVLVKQGNAPGAMTLYVNGSAAPTFADFENDFPITMQTTGSEVDIGRRTYVGFNQLFSGAMAGVRVYNRALAAGEVATLFANGPVIPTTAPVTGPATNNLPTPPDGVTNGLVAWYPLAGDANDYSGSGNNGKPTGSPTYTTGVTGVANTAISLNGSSQYISLGHPSLHNFGTGDFTMSVWFRTTSTSAPQQLLSCDDASGRQFIFDLNDLSAGTITAYVQNQTAIVGYRTGNILSPNTWYSAVLVKHGNVPGAMTLYLNGSIATSFADFQNDFPVTMQATSSEVDIGRRTYVGFNQLFSGSMAGVRVYNRALSAAEISAIYTSGTSTTATTPIQSLTATTLAASPNPAAAGGTVTFTATVTGNGGTPSGTVAFFDGPNNLGSAPLNGSGVATLSTSTLTAGGSPHSITAVYSGNASSGTSTSSALAQIITSPAATTTTTLTSSQNPALLGSTLTFTATVTGSSGVPSGTVAFLDGANNLGTATLNASGVGALSTATLSASGSPHVITAVYAGNSGFLDSTSSALSQIITNAPALPVSTNTDITNGLVAWYPLAGDANDYSGNANDGTRVGNPAYTTGVSGVANTAISLNGINQYVSLGHPSLYNFGTGDFTMLVWFHTTSTSTPQQLFSCDDASGRQFILDINDLSSGTITAYVHSQTSDVGYRTGNILSTNTWYSAVLVKQGNAAGAMTLYLNGASVPSFADFQNEFPITMQATSSEVDIGRRTYAGFNQLFSGSMCGVRVYNRALAAGEVATLYANGPILPTNAVPSSAVITDGLVAWYPLAGDANDHSGNGNNGNPTGSPNFTNGVNGATGTAISLNGTNQYISLGHPNLYNFGAGDFSMSVWFRTTTTSTPQQLLSCDDILGRQFIFDLNDLSSGTITAYVQNQTSDVGYRTGNILSPNTWYSAILVKHGNSSGAMTLYLNGSALASFTAFQNDFPLAMQATTSEVDIGRRTYTGYNQPFSGSMCGVRVYNRALSAGEVSTIYASGADGTR